ncbi:Crp/Fnr family transcriptional regulator [Oceanitalea stevensii]|uniref:Crp/Fnr family transcriptional regulator n=1 Tax=Oceanitalea stevensii TaxID=2763072 RepID=A0ABR8Z0T7_9MICO|nr:Crp/Fnr family transcriptional regulator [Oceanitalea stevensii]MBD8061910.1 Crp/Fnr family transcriptional regulator [Oceanitalea stevensii]
MSPQDAAPVRTESGRRTIPLREVTLPHRCPWPVRRHVLTRAPYFRGLSEDAVERIDRRMRTTTWPAGRTLYRAGDPATALYVVAEGRVKLSQVTAGGTETVADILVPGELFGAMGTLGEPYHSHTATALVGSCTLRIDQDDFREVLLEHPGVALRVLDDVAARLVRAHSDIGGQTTDTVPQRVATALLRLADKVGEERDDGTVMLEVPLSRADLAGLARSTPESVSRVMSRWKKEGVVDSGRRWTALLDRRRLEAEAAGDTPRPDGV